MCSAEHQILVISIMPISKPNPMFDHLLESSFRDDSNKMVKHRIWGRNKTNRVEAHFMFLIWSSAIVAYLFEIVKNFFFERHENTLLF